MTERKLLFATHNRGKLVELQSMLGGIEGLRVLSLDDFAPGEVPDVVEDGDTFIANASKKAREVSEATGLPALADDSGLEVDALDGRPGVYSARFAGEQATDRENNDKLLRSLEGVVEAKRGARFRSILALADTAGSLGQRILTASGHCDGRILLEPRGVGGFGYDPLFWLEAERATFAEIDPALKNRISHRAVAMREMLPHLTDYFDLKT